MIYQNPWPRGDLARALVMGLLGLACLAYVLLTPGCSPVAVVLRGDHRGRAVRAYVTVAHVASGQPVLVRDNWWEGDVLCDPVTTNLGLAQDPVTLLIPRCEPFGRRGPGDSGAPLVDSDGRVLGLHRGQLVVNLEAR